MCVFPDIDYRKESPIGLQNGDGHGLHGTAKGMYTRLKNLNIVDEHFLDGIENVNDLERHIFDLIDDYPENGISLDRIFHMIQIWGGSTGSGVYKNQLFEWDVVGPLYKKLVDTTRGLKDITSKSQNVLYLAIKDYYNGLHCHKHKHTGMGVAFITKHTRYWMHRNHPDDMLPIYDSTFSANVMQKGSYANIDHLLPYWKVMIQKAKKEGISLTSLERRIFNYYRSLPRQKNTHADEKHSNQAKNVCLRVYDKGDNCGKTFHIEGLSGLQQASAVYVEYKGQRFKANLGTYNSKSSYTLGGEKSIHRNLILANGFQPGQVFECDFKVEGDTHLYIIKS